MAVLLEAIRGPLAGKVFTFAAPDTFIFGRGDKVHCHLGTDPAVSRFHFMVEANPPAARLQDLGSTNGVYVNDAKIGGREAGATMEVELRHGDRIRVGQSIFLVRVADETPDENPDAPGAASLPAQPGLDLTKRLSADPGQNTAIERPPSGRLIAAIVDATQIEPPPPAIQGYEGLEKIGNGAAGVVYRARRSEDGRAVAIKLLKSASGVRETTAARFFREIEITQKVRHPNVVEFIAAGRLNNSMYLVLEYMAGGDLARHLRNFPGGMPAAEATSVILQATAGMAAAHKEGVIHRDIKPANLLFADERATVCKISDLGLAKSLDERPNLTATGSGGGTPAYMAPEQITNFRHATPAADVFSLASTFYELLTRRSAYNFVKDRNYITTILDGDIVPLPRRRPDLPEELSSFVMRGLAIDPAARYADAGDMLSALQAIAPAINNA